MIAIVPSIPRYSLHILLQVKQMLDLDLCVSGGMKYFVSLSVLIQDRLVLQRYSALTLEY